MTSNDRQPAPAILPATQLHDLGDLLSKRQPGAKGRVLTVLVAAALLMVAYKLVNEVRADVHAAAIAQVIAET